MTEQEIVKRIKEECKYSVCMSCEFSSKSLISNCVFEYMGLGKPISWNFEKPEAQHDD